MRGLIGRCLALFLVCAAASALRGQDGEQGDRLREALERRPFSETLIQRWLDHLTNSGTTEAVLVELAQEPDEDVVVQWLLARLDAHRGQTTDALARLDMVCEATQVGDPELFRARLLESDRQIRPALKALQRARTKQLAPEARTQATLRCARLHLRLGEVDDARTELENLRVAHPEDHALHEEIAHLHESEGQWAEALKAWRHLRTTSDEDALRYRAGVAIARVLEQTDGPEAALAQLEGLRDETSADSWQSRVLRQEAEALLRRSGGPDRWLSFLRGWIEDDDHPELRQTLARALLDVGQIDEALEEIDALLVALPLDRAHHELRIRLLIGKGRLTEAVAAAEEMVSLLSEDLVAWETRARTIEALAGAEPTAAAIDAVLESWTTLAERQPDTWRTILHAAESCRAAALRLKASPSLLDGSYGLFRRAIDASAADPTPAHSFARALHSDGHTDRAQEVLITATERGDPALLRSTATVAESLEFADLAVRFLRRALDVEPDVFADRDAIVRILLDHDQLEEAERELRALERCAADHPQLAQALTRRVEVFMRLGTVHEIVVALVERNDRTLRDHWLLALASHALEGSRRSVPYYALGVDQHPDVIPLREEFAEALSSVDPAQAILEYRELLARDDARGPLWLERIVRLEIARNYLQGAEATAKELLLRTPHSPDAILLRAHVATLRRDHRTACQVLRRAVLQHPDHLALRMQFATALVADDKPREALDQWIRALRMEEPARYRSMVSEASKVAWEAGLGDEWIAMLDRLLEETPDPSMAFIAAAARSDLGRVDEASKMLEDLLRQRPDDLAVLRELVAILHDGQAERAMGFQRQIWRATGSDGDRETLARLTSRAGRFQEAIPLWCDVLRGTESHTIATRVERLHANGHPEMACDVATALLTLDPDYSIDWAMAVGHRARDLDPKRAVPFFAAAIDLSNPECPSPPTYEAQDPSLVMTGDFGEIGPVRVDAGGHEFIAVRGVFGVTTVGNANPQLPERSPVSGSIDHPYHWPMWSEFAVYSRLRTLQGAAPELATQRTTGYLLSGRSSIIHDPSPRSNADRSQQMILAWASLIEANVPVEEWAPAESPVRNPDSWNETLIRLATYASFISGDFDAARSAAARISESDSADPLPAILDLLIFENRVLDSEAKPTPHDRELASQAVERLLAQTPAGAGYQIARAHAHHLCAAGHPERAIELVKNTLTANTPVRWIVFLFEPLERWAKEASEELRIAVLGERLRQPIEDDDLRAALWCHQRRANSSPTEFAELLLRSLVRQELTPISEFPNLQQIAIQQADGLSWADRLVFPRAMTELDAFHVVTLRSLADQPERLRKVHDHLAASDQSRNVSVRRALQACRWWLGEREEVFAELHRELEDFPRDGALGAAVAAAALELGRYRKARDAAIELTARRLEYVDAASRQIVTRTDAFVDWLNDEIRWRRLYGSDEQVLDGLLDALAAPSGAHLETYAYIPTHLQLKEADDQRKAYVRARREDVKRSFVFDWTSSASMKGGVTVDRPLPDLLALASPETLETIIRHAERHKALNSTAQVILALAYAQCDRVEDFSKATAYWQQETPRGVRRIDDLGGTWILEALCRHPSLIDQALEIGLGRLDAAIDRRSRERALKIWTTLAQLGESALPQELAPTLLDSWTGSAGSTSWLPDDTVIAELRPFVEATAADRRASLLKQLAELLVERSVQSHQTAFLSDSLPALLYGRWNDLDSKAKSSILEVLLTALFPEGSAGPSSPLEWRNDYLSAASFPLLDIALDLAEEAGALTELGTRWQTRPDASSTDVLLMRLRLAERQTDRSDAESIRQILSKRLDWHERFHRGRALRARARTSSEGPLPPGEQSPREAVLLDLEAALTEATDDRDRAFLHRTIASFCEDPKARHRHLQRAFDLDPRSFPTAVMQPLLSAPNLAEHREANAKRLADLLPADAGFPRHRALRASALVLADRAPEAAAEWKGLVKDWAPTFKPLDHLYAALAFHRTGDASAAKLQLGAAQSLLRFQPDAMANSLLVRVEAELKFGS